MYYVMAERLGPKIRPGGLKLAFAVLCDLGQIILFPCALIDPSTK